MFLGNLQVSRLWADRDSLEYGHIFPGGSPCGAPWQQLAFRNVLKTFSEFPFFFKEFPEYFGSLKVGFSSNMCFLEICKFPGSEPLGIH